ncbi:MAG: NUDIX domain-containing protein [Micropruina sp.]|nr:NUDIX domain-containing protein [Micropruina sp.]
MTGETFRTRRFTPLPVEQRPVRARRASRVVITDGTAVLLFADTDPGVPGSRWWVTPGGGIDPGETPLAAAVREVAEETGLIVQPEQVVGPVAHRVTSHGYSDQVINQDELFFLLQVPSAFEVDSSGHTEGEQLTIAESRWVPISDLGDLSDPVWPDYLGVLPGLAAQPAVWPVEFGHEEESVVGLTPDQLARCRISESSSVRHERTNASST